MTSNGSRPPDKRELMRLRSVSTRRKIESLEQALQERERDRPDIAEDIAEEISGVIRDDIEKAFGRITQPSTPSIHVHVDAPASSRSEPPSALQKAIQKAGVPKTLAATIAMLIGVGLALCEVWKAIHQ